MFEGVRSLQSAGIFGYAHIHSHEQSRDGPPQPVGKRKPGGFLADLSSFSYSTPPPGADPEYVERTAYSSCEL